MPSRTITVTIEAYNHLKEMKMTEESFTDFIERLYHKETAVNLDDFAGILTNEEAEELKKETIETRRKLGEGLGKKSLRMGL